MHSSLIVATQINSFQPVCENRACIFTEIKIHTDKNYINCVANTVYHKKKDFARDNKKIVNTGAFERMLTVEIHYFEIFVILR